MKTTFKYILALLVMMLAIPGSMAKDLTAEKASKSGELKFANVSTDKGLYIHYNFGDIELIAWDKKDILLKYTEEVQAPTAEKAKQALAKRVIHNTENEKGYVLEMSGGSYGSVPCWYGQSKGQHLQDGAKKENDISFKSRWIIYLPAKMAETTVQNSFGNIDVKDGYQGDLTVQLQFGDINMGKRDKQAGNHIEIQHGAFNITDCNKLKLSTKFTSGTINNAGTLEMLCLHGQNIKMGTVQELNLRTQHSGLQIEKVDSIKVTAAHSNINITSSAKSVALEMQHSGITIESLEHSLTAAQVAHSSIETTIGRKNTAPQFSIARAGFSSVTVSIPNSLAVCCDLQSKFGMTEINLPSSVRKTVIKQEEKDFNSTNTFYLNTNKHLPSSYIKINSTHGVTKIKGY